MSIKPSTRRVVTITDHQSTSTSRAPAQVGNFPSARRDLHPLPAIHLDAEDMTPQGLQKKFMDVYEALRVRTDAMAKNPLTAPAFERRIKFQNTTGTGKVVSVTFPHSLGRPPTNGVTCIHAEGQAFSGYSVPNPNGEDPATHQTVAAWLPANSTAFYSFALHAD